jgi:Secretion system C-terminal sorting domain/Matrixin
MIACINKALKDWRCSTGINWYLDTQSTNVDTTKHDSISTIYFKPFPFVVGTPNVIAQTFRNKMYCNGVNSKMVYANDIDFQIDPNDTIDFFYDTTFTQSVQTGKHDFYHTILHELGHAALLEHCNQLNSIMYPFITPGPIPANQRKTFIGIDNVHGGQDVVNLSSTISYANCNQSGNMIPSTTGNCAGTSGERGIEATQNNVLNIYPNPTNDLLNISYTINSNCMVKVQLINSIGQILKEVSNEQSIGSYTLTVDTKMFAKGIYFIKFTDGVNIKQAKVIIQ